jgi:hypothetical protein
MSVKFGFNPVYLEADVVDYNHVTKGCRDQIALVFGPVT